MNREVSLPGRSSGLTEGDSMLVTIFDTLGA